MNWEIGVAVGLLLSTSSLATAQGNAQLAEHQHLAQQYLSEGKPSLAIPELKVVVQLEPSNVDAHANLGVLLYFAGNYSEAIPELSAAVTGRPGLPKIQMLLGISEKRTGALQAAARDLATAFPSLTDLKLQKEAGLNLVETDQALGLLDKAAEVISVLQTTEPADPQVLSAAYQVYSQGQSEALLSLAMSAPDSPELHFIMGQQLVEQGETAAALTQFRRAMALDPDLPGLHHELAEALSSAADPALRTKAEAEYKAAVKLDAFDEKAWLGLANMEADRGALAQATADYNRALALQPNDADAETGLAKVFIANQQRPQAIALLERAVRSDPTNPTAHYRLSMLYRQEARLDDAKQQLALYEHYKAVHAALQAAIHTMRTGDSTKSGNVSQAPPEAMQQ